MAEVHYPHAPARDDDENPSVHHEATDVNLRAILEFGAGLLVVAIFIHFAIWLLFMYFDGRERAAKTLPMYPLAVGQENRLPPEPRLQTNPREDLKVLRDDEDVMLNSYGWVDKNAGVVHIPIGEAMKLTLERGLPTRASR
jgi:hypothetical protein